MGWPRPEGLSESRPAFDIRRPCLPGCFDVLEDLFTLVLDWNLSEVNNQVGYADLVLTRLSVKHLIVAAKRPGALAWNELAQAHRYAGEQKVQSIAISDGCHTLCPRPDSRRPPRQGVRPPRSAAAPGRPAVAQH